MKNTRFIQFLCSLLIGVILMLTIITGLIVLDLITNKSSDLIFTTQSLEAVYDGTPLTNHQWSLTQGSLKEGHKVIAAFTGSQTQTGESANTMSVKIVDENGNDVTDEYSIDYAFGTLTVSQRELKLDAEMDLDGLYPVQGKYTLNSDQIDLLDGHYAVVSVTSTTGDLGLPEETVDNITIYDENGVDVTHNYNIYLKEKGDTIVIPGGNLASASISTSLSGETISGELTEGQPLFSVYADTNAFVYFRTQSCGDYTGTGWDSAPVFPALYEDTYAASYLTSFYLEKRNLTAHQMEIVSHIPDYPLPYYLATTGGSYDLQRNDAVNVGSTAQSYVVPFYVFDTSYLSPSSSSDVFENAYRNFVHDNYLAMDQETLDYMNAIIKSQGFSKDTPRIIQKVASYIQNAAAYNTNYNRKLDKAPNNAIAFLSTYKEGVCRHYATAATLLYRALGFPARFTVGAFAEVKANEWVDVTSLQAHAWVEVYLDGIGWIQVEVTGAPSEGGNGDDGPCEDCGDSQCDGNCGGGGGSGAGGNQAGVPKKLELTPKTVTKKYDGTPLYPDGQIAGLEELLQQGYQYTASVFGSQTNVGVSHSIIEGISIYDPRGNDVTSSFEITTKPGRIHIYLYEIVFYSDDITKVYDGLAFDDYAIHTNAKYLHNNDYFNITITADPNVGTKDATFDIRMISSKGVDVTDQYLITKEYGTLTITPAEITLKAGDATKKYDGTPLTCQDYTLHKGMLIDGHALAQVITSGTQIEIGRSENMITYVRIVDANGTDVTGNYIIWLIAGKLRVTAS